MRPSRNGINGRYEQIFSHEKGALICFDCGTIFSCFLKVGNAKNEQKNLQQAFKNREPTLLSRILDSAKKLNGEDSEASPHYFRATRHNVS